LIAKLNIINTLVSTVANTTSIIITYIFANTVVVLLEKMKLDFKPPLPHSRFLVLPVIFAFVFLLAFFSINIVRVFAKLMAKTLKSYSTNTLAYSVTVMFMARFLAEATSPFSGNLQMSLTATNTSYKKYIKKT